MNVALDLVCGISWSLVYIAAVTLGFRYRTWCIPKLPICMNFSWEFWVVWSRIRAGLPFNIPFAIQLSWLILDVGILVTWLLYDRKSKGQTAKNVSMLLVTFAVVYWLTCVHAYWHFSVFLINVIMSAEFILHLRRDPANWISKTVAIWKLIGTLAATILNGVLTTAPIVLWLGGICFLLDVYYIYELQMKLYEGGIDRGKTCSGPKGRKKSL